MLTLSYGFKKPVSGDRGPTVFPALEDNWQRVNDHDHDGSNSKPINSIYFSKTKQTLLAASWVDLGNGHYKQTATLPLTIKYADVTLEFRLSTGEVVYPTVTAGAGEQQYDVYFDDSSKNLTVIIN